MIRRILILDWEFGVHVHGSPYHDTCDSGLEIDWDSEEEEAGKGRDENLKRDCVLLQNTVQLLHKYSGYKTKA